LSSSHGKVLTDLFDFSGHFVDKVFSLLLKLLLDRSLSHKTFPSLEFSHQLSRRALFFRENLFSEFTADFLLDRLKHSFVGLTSILPSVDKDLVGVERIDFSEGLKEAFD
jgi:hypothetical protein